MLRFTIVLFLTLYASFFANIALAIDKNKTLQHIAFGSCLKQNKAQPVWDRIVATQPDVFLFMGDNVYVDSSDATVIRDKYATLAANPAFKRTRNKLTILPIWDDHDYGKNDAGREFAAKQLTKNAFLDFFAIPKDDPRHQRDGLYTAYQFGQQGKKVQIILLDTRWFRSLPPTEATKQKKEPATILGKEQWQWLAEQLKQPADLRLLISSIQVIPEQHRWEKWANFPAERNKLLQLLKDSHANGVILLSGDRHLAEISMLPTEQSGLNYPLYEITASGMNSAIGWLKGEEQNKHRLGSNYRADHFGLLTIDWQQDDPIIHAQIHDVEKADIVLEQKLQLSTLQPKQL